MVGAGEEQRGGVRLVWRMVGLCRSWWFWLI